MTARCALFALHLDVAAGGAVVDGGAARGLLAEETLREGGSGCGRGRLEGE